MLSATKRVFYEVFTRNRRFVIPFFQRSYVWKRENWERFLNDMENIMENREHYFMGSFVFKPSDEGKAGHIEKKMVIDGQQRITTIILFLKAISELNPSDYVKSTCNSIIFNLSNGSARESVVEHNYNDVEIFEAILDGKLRTSLTEKYANNNVLNCYNYFLEHQDIILTIDPEDIAAHMYFISVDLAKEEDEQQIFDIINTHGVSLTAAELLKNYLFNKGDKDLYENTWKKTFEFDESIRKFWDYEVKYGNKSRSNIDFFLQAYLIKVSNGKYVGLEKLFSNYKSFISGNNIKANKKEKEKFIKNLDSASQVYFENLNPYISREISFNNSPFDVLNTIIFGLNITQIIPYILYIMEELENDEVELDKMLSLLNSYLVRRLICGKTPKRYPDIFISFVKDKVNNYKKLKGKIYGFDNFEYDIFPDDIDFKDSFLASNLQHAHSRIILCMLEKQFTDIDKDNKILRSMNAYTLEHIMPKKWEDNWFKKLSKDEENTRRELIRSFGNLTILTGRLNSKLGNSSWKNKKEKMKEYCSGIRTFEGYLDSSDWNEETIKQRGEYLFGIAKDIWKY